MGSGNPENFSFLPLSSDSDNRPRVSQVLVASLVGALTPDQSNDRLSACSAIKRK